MDYLSKARFIGEIIGQLSAALSKVDMITNQANIFKTATEWAIPTLAKKILEFLTHVMQLQQYCLKALRMAIPYVIITNQLIATAWFSGEEKYKELYEINKEMTKWMVLNFDKISFEQE